MESTGKIFIVEGAQIFSLIYVMTAEQQNLSKPKWEYTLKNPNSLAQQGILLTNSLLCPITVSYQKEK